MVATDYWKAYEIFVDKDIHKQSKAETYTVEGYNSFFRHFLVRMRRERQNVIVKVLKCLNILLHYLGLSGMII